VHRLFLLNRECPTLRLYRYALAGMQRTGSEADPTFAPPPHMGSTEALHRPSQESNFTAPAALKHLEQRRSTTVGGGPSESTASGVEKSGSRCSSYSRSSSSGRQAAEAPLPMATNRPEPIEERAVRAVVALPSTIVRASVQVVADYSPVLPRRIVPRRSVPDGTSPPDPHSP